MSFLLVQNVCACVFVCCMCVFVGEFNNNKYNLFQFFSLIKKKVRRIKHQSNFCIRKNCLQTAEYG